VRAGGNLLIMSDTYSSTHLWLMTTFTYGSMTFFPASMDIILWLIGGFLNC
jgi:hypothetical protein